MNYSEKVCAWALVLGVLLLFLVVVTQPAHGEEATPLPTLSARWQRASKLLDQLEANYKRQEQISQALKQDSATLRSDLQKLKEEASILKSDLERALNDLELSKAEAESLRNRLEKADASLANSEASLTRSEAAGVRLSKEVGILRVVAIVVGVLAAAGWAAFGVSMTF